MTFAPMSAYGKSDKRESMTLAVRLKEADVLERLDPIDETSTIYYSACDTIRDKLIRAAYPDWKTTPVDMYQIQDAGVDISTSLRILTFLAKYDPNIKRRLQLWALDCSTRVRHLHTDHQTWDNSFTLPMRMAVCWMHVHNKEKHHKAEKETFDFIQNTEFEDYKESLIQDGLPPSAVSAALSSFCTLKLALEDIDFYEYCLAVIRHAEDACCSGAKEAVEFTFTPFCPKVGGRTLRDVMYDCLRDYVTKMIKETRKRDQQWHYTRLSLRLSEILEPKDTLSAQEPQRTPVVESPSVDLHGRHERRTPENLKKSL